MGLVGELAGELQVGGGDLVSGGGGDQDRQGAKVQGQDRGAGRVGVVGRSGTAAGVERDGADALCPAACYQATSFPETVVCLTAAEAAAVEAVVRVARIWRALIE